MNHTTLTPGSLYDDLYDDWTQLQSAPVIDDIDQVSMTTAEVAEFDQLFIQGETHGHRETRRD